MLPLIATLALLFDKCYPASSRQVFKWKVTAPVCEAPGGPSRFALRELPAGAARQPPPEDTSLRISDGHSRFGAPVTTTDHNCRPIPSTCQAPINFFPFLRTSRFGTAPDRALLLPPTGSSAKNGPKGTSQGYPHPPHSKSSNLDRPALVCGGLAPLSRRRCACCRAATWPPDNRLPGGTRAADDSRWITSVRSKRSAPAPRKQESRSKACPAPLAGVKRWPLPCRSAPG
jgi:hypothetical protein